jgi:hypothetical protein
MTPAWWRHVAPPERQHYSKDRTNTTSYRDDRGGGIPLRGRAGRYESGPLANNHTHVGNAKGLSPSFVRHPDNEGGVGRNLVDPERGRGGKDHQ